MKKHIEQKPKSILEAIRKAQEVECQKAYREALRREAIRLSERRKKNEALAQKLFFASELEKSSDTLLSS